MSTDATTAEADSTWAELDDLEADLRRRAAELRHTANGMRDAAREHDGRAAGLIEAADRLAAIERPA